MHENGNEHYKKFREGFQQSVFNVVLQYNAQIARYIVRETDNNLLVE